VEAAAAPMMIMYLVSRREKLTFGSASTKLSTLWLHCVS
jgi:hypothetical protein